MKLEELEVLITANTKNLQKEIAATNKKIESLKKSADKTRSGVLSSFSKLATGIAALGIGRIIKNSITSGMDAIESDSLFETSLGSLADGVRSWSEEMSEALGLDATAMRKNTGVIYNMTNSMGIAGENALKMSKGITMLTEDMASFYNLSSEEAFNKLKAGITGEAEPLKALGILVDENTIKQVAYQHGIANTGAELTQQQKVLARYVAILQQTGNAQGDLARTIDSPSNQLRILKNQVVSLGRAFSNILMPLISAVIPYLTAFAKVVTYALNSLAKFLGIGGGSSSSSSGAGALAGTLGDVSDSLGSANKGVSGVNTGLKDANKNAKKLKGQLASFDEMTVLTDKDSASAGAGTTGGSGAGGTGGVGGAIGGIGADGFTLGDYETPLNNVGNKVNEIAEKIKKAFSNFASGINFNNLISSFNNLKDSLAPLGSTIWNGLKWAWDNLLKPLAQWTIGDLLPAFLNAVSGALDVLNPILSDAMSLLEWLWDNFLEPVVSWTGGVIVDVLNAFGDALSWIGEHESVIALIEGLAISIALVEGALTLWNTAVAVWNSIGVICTAVTGAFASVMAFLTSPITLTIGAIALLVAGIILLVKNWDTVKETAKKVWDKIKEMWGAVADWFKTKVIEPLKNYFSPLTEWFSKLFNSIKGTIKSAFDVISGLGKGCWEIIKQAWSVASNWFNTKIVSPVKNFFGGLWSKVKSGGKDAWTGIKNAFSPVTNWFSDKFSTAWSKVKKVFSTGGKVFSGIKEGIEKTFKTVVNAIIKGINKVIATPFDTINGMLNKIRTAKFLGIQPFKDKWSHNPLAVPKIPLLARGGVVDSPTLAMIGEAGKEAVVPLENNTQWIDKLADKISSRSNGDVPIQLTVKLGEDNIFNRFIQYSRAKAFETNGEVFSL